MDAFEEVVLLPERSGVEHEKWSRTRTGARMAVDALGGAARGNRQTPSVRSVTPPRAGSTGFSSRHRMVGDSIASAPRTGINDQVAIT